MHSITAATVTVEDLQTYFKGPRGDHGDKWRTEIDRDGLWAISDMYTIHLNAEGAMYSVEIAAKDDSSDSDSTVTDDPIGFIVDFMGTGSAGDEFFQKRSSVAPVEVSLILRKAADDYDAQRIDTKRLANVVRRTMIYPDLDLVQQIAASIRISSRTDMEIKEMDKIKARLKEKGWKISEKETEHGFPVLEVDIGGVFDAKITVDHVIWHYTYQVNQTDMKKSGTTDDPISTFRNFYRDDDVKAAKSEHLRLKQEESGTNIAPGSKSDEGTVGPKSKPQEEGTVAPARKRASYFETFRKYL